MYLVNVMASGIPTYLLEEFSQHFLSILGSRYSLVMQLKQNIYHRCKKGLEVSMWLLYYIFLTFIADTDTITDIAFSSLNAMKMETLDYRGIEGGIKTFY